MITTTINYAQMEEQYKAYDKDALYRAIKQEESMLTLDETDDALYQAFYAAEKTSNIGIVEEVEELIKVGNDSLAAIKTAAMQDTKLIDYYRKTVNEIYLTTFAKGNYDLTAQQIAILYLIATDYTPWEGGDAVYIASLMH
ncbi:MAG: hypothetical protein ACOYKE_14525 [Ferruginibacter sp.]